MAQVTLLAGESAALNTTGKAGVLVWDRQDVPTGQRSVPAFCDAHLPQLRAELLAMVYDLGRAQTPGGQGKEVQEHLQGGDPLSMWWCSLLFEKHPKVTPDVYPALKLRALEWMLEESELPWDTLCLHGGDATLVASLREFCEATGRVFTHIAVTPGTCTEQSGLKSHLRRLYYALPGPAKAALRFGAWLWQCRALLRGHAHCSGQSRPAQSCGTIATYFPNVDMNVAQSGRFRSRYWEDLHTALAPCTPSGDKAEAACADVNWLFIRFPSPQASLQQCIALRDRFRQEKRDGRSFHYLEEFLTVRDMAAALRRYVRLSRAGKALASSVRPLFRLGNSRMNVWGYLGQYWEDSFRGWRCLERCLQHRAMRNYVRWAGPQRWTIFPMENCPWERMLTEEVHAAGHGPVYGTQHSTVRPTDFRYFDDPRAFSTPDCLRFQPDRILGNGRGACTEMLAAGTPQERLGMVEALRYMYLSGRVDTAPQTPPVPCSRLLVVTSFFADEVDAHMRALARWMREHQAGSAAAQWEVVLKPHPYLAVEPYLEKYFAGMDMPPVVQEPIGGLLTPGTAVWASNSTTVALEAALMGLPVLVQRPENDVDLCPLQGVEGVARIVDAIEVSRALASPCKAQLPSDYLALNPALPLWRDLLGLHKGMACQQ